MSTTSTTSPLSISSFAASCSSSSTKNYLHRPQLHCRVALPAVSESGSGAATTTTKSNHLFSSSIHHHQQQQQQQRRRRPLSCEVALKTDDAPVGTSEEEEEDAEMKRAQIGARVRVIAPVLKVYHVPKVPEIDLTGMEGELKQYVALWKGKRISANFPFKVEFFTQVEGRGRVKFFAHLREDEFEYIQ